MNVALTQDLEQLIDEQMTQGPYRDAVEVIREGLRLLKASGRPAPQQVRVAGRLQGRSADGRGFELVLDSGETLLGTADPAKVRELSGELVVVAGLASFRASGHVEHVAAEEVEPARGDQAVWAEAPRPFGEPLDLKRLESSAKEAPGLQVVFGKWPGDESDDEVFAALEALS
jgi:putative addiction module CopG family antidote